MGQMQAVRVDVSRVKLQLHDCLTPQLCLAHICGPISSLPTRPSMKDPQWEPSPPRPSLSTWTTKQMRGMPPHWLLTCWCVPCWSLVKSRKAQCVHNIASQTHTWQLCKYAPPNVTCASWRRWLSSLGNRFTLLCILLYNRVFLWINDQGYYSQQILPGSLYLFISQQSIIVTIQIL